MSIILSVLGINTSTVFYINKMNLYHIGDEEPFANLIYKDGHASLRVNSGETFKHASNLNMGRYVNN
jgi:hypothetical protein